MKILITGAGGFIGRNLVAALRALRADEIIEYHSSTGLEQLKKLCGECDFVFHLAGVNRPTREEAFWSGNVEFTRALVEALEPRDVPIVFTSSTQAALDNPYGRSKLAAEEILRRRSARSMIFRLPNVFGKWSRPNYNSVVATFCFNIARGLDIRVDDPAHRIDLVYIDDVIEKFLAALDGDDDCSVPIKYNRSVGELAELIRSFSRCRAMLSIPDQNDDFTRKLYGTYQSFLPPEQFGYELLMHKDARGSFSEFVRTDGQGQFSINIVKPGITKGNHWHHSKHEKFLVIVGSGVIRLRPIDSEEIIEYFVSGERFEVIDIPPGWTHSIENIGEADMAVVIWANENFDPNRPDTYFLNVSDIRK